MTVKQRSYGIQEDYVLNIGKQVAKSKNLKDRQPKPFKSGSKINTVKGIINHPILKNELAYIFEEDDSYVECRRCFVVTDDNYFEEGE